MAARNTMMPAPITHSAMLSYALAYARRGWPVFPLHTPTKQGGCSCGKPCGNPGKHPRTHNGFKQATTDEETVRRWWGQWPDANIGISTGAANILAVDVDPKNGGAYLPNRTERRRAASLMRRTYVGGKLSNNAQKNRVLRLNYEDRCARRDALAKVS